MLENLMKCEHCGAILVSHAMECSFCRAPTAAGVRAREQAEYEERNRAVLASAATQQQTVAAQNRLQATVTQSMWWSIIGLVICCLPVALVGFVQGLRARGLAKSLGVPLPGGALIGLVLSSVGGLCSIGFATWVIISSGQDKDAADARIKILEGQTERPAMAAGLTQPTACALAEAYGLKTGHAGSAGYTLGHFDCLGKLTVEADKASLDTFRFMSGQKKLDVNVCFKRGARWYVTSMQEAPCNAAPPAASK